MICPMSSKYASSAVRRPSISRPVCQPAPSNRWTNWWSGSASAAGSVGTESVRNDNVARWRPTLSGRRVAARPPGVLYQRHQSSSDATRSTEKYAIETPRSRRRTSPKAGSRSLRVVEPIPSAMIATSKVSLRPSANTTRTSSPGFEESMRSIQVPNRRSRSPWVRSSRSSTNWPRRISRSAVAPSLSEVPAGNSPTLRSCSSTKRVPTSPVPRSPTASSRSIRRSTWRAAPRRSTFCPPVRSAEDRSTTVHCQPDRVSHQPAASPATPAPEMSARRVIVSAFLDRSFWTGVRRQARFTAVAQPLAASIADDAPDAASR